MVTLALALSFALGTSFGTFATIQLSKEVERQAIVKTVNFTEELMSEDNDIVDLNELDYINE